jgi:hypothetical protein
VRHACMLCPFSVIICSFDGRGVEQSGSSSGS